MTYKEAKGKTVDEAITNGLSELGLSIDEVNIEIVHEGSKGFFGLGKSALVRLTVKEDDAPASIKNAEPMQKSQPKREEKKTEEPKAEAPKEPVTIDEQGAQASEFLSGLFQIMEIEADVTVEKCDAQCISIDLTGKDTAVLIGRRGDTLDALQYLTSLTINKGNVDYKKVMLDAEDYRRKREATLEKLARRLASGVAKTGKSVKLEPMNPYERRILHATLQNNSRVETFSEGEEPYRCVVIKRKRSQSYEG